MALITPETARAMAALSAESRRLNPLKAVPPGFKLVPANYGEPTEHVPTSDDYPAIVLARVRGQLDLVAKQITLELLKDKPDSRRLRDLTDAQTRLSEQERILAGRPLPGSHRPSTKRDPDKTPAEATPMWTEPTPACGVQPPTGSVQP